MELLKNIKIEKVYAIDIETVSVCNEFHELDSDLKRAFIYKMVSDGHTNENHDNICELWNERSSLHAEFSKICAISICFLNKKQDKLVCKSIANDDEITLLNDLSFILDSIENSDSENRLIGHSSKFFDYPFICKRYVINGMSIPKIIDTAHLKPWEGKNLCLNNDIWKMGGTGPGATLLTMCACLNLEISKDSISGCDVKKEYYNGNLGLIADYCNKDTISTYNIFSKLKGCGIFKFSDVKYI